MWGVERLIAGLQVGCGAAQFGEGLGLQLLHRAGLHPHRTAQLVGGEGRPPEVAVADHPLLQGLELLEQLRQERRG